MRPLTKIALVFSISSACSATVAYAKTVRAANYRRYPANICSTFNASGSNPPVINLGAGSIANTGPASSMLGVECPFIDDTTIPKENLASLWVDVFNNANPSYTPTAAACVKDNMDQGGSCASYSGTLPQGHTGIDVNTSLWKTADGSYTFLSIYVPGNQSAVYGVSAYTN